MIRTLVRAASLCALLAVMTTDAGAQAKKTDKRPKTKLGQELVSMVEKPQQGLEQTVVEGLTVENLAIIRNGKVLIDAVATDGDGQKLLTALNAMGLEGGSAYQRMVSGFFPVDNLSQLESLASLNHVNASLMPQKSAGIVVSQGDAAMKADLARTAYGVDGSGSKIGVLSDSYNNRNGAATGVLNGELPNDVEVLLDYAPGGDEGRAMMELIHDVAPGAKMAFHTAFTGQAGFANGIRALADAGCNIIVDDVFYFAEPMFQDGLIAQAVDEVVKEKVTYFSAAGNSANNSYESVFKPSGIIVPTYGEAHDFGNGDIRQTFTIRPFGSFRVGLQWDDPFYAVSGGAGAQTDLDLLVYVNGVLAFRSVSNNIGKDPFEFVGLASNSPNPINVEIVITKFSGPDPRYIKWVHFGNGVPAQFIEYNTNSSTCVGHPNAKGAIAVGAAAFFNTPAFNNNLTTAVVNSFSAKGGAPVFIKNDGKSIGFDDGKRRAKPEITGPDGGNNSFFGSDSPNDPDAYPNFFGTSAAAPHAAAVAALMQQARKVRMTPAAVLDIMKQSALDMDDPETPGFDIGFDYRTGAGLIQADKCVELAGGGGLMVQQAAVAAVADIAVGTIAVGPNPTRGQVKLVLNTLVKNGSLEILGASGQPVLLQRIAETPAQVISLDLGSQVPGMYLLKVKGDNFFNTTKVLLLK